jgi:hypothetical protein
MVRIGFAVAVIAVVATTAGCTMCCHPYDGCGPVFEGHGRYATGCSCCARAGSVYSECADASMSTSEMPVQNASARAKTRIASQPARSTAATVPTKARSATRQRPSSTEMAGTVKKPRPATHQRARSAEAAGSEKILSVTDHAVDSPKLAAGSQAQPEKISAEAARPLADRGWTARRSSPDETVQ